VNISNSSAFRRGEGTFSAVSRSMADVNVLRSCTPYFIMAGWLRAERNITVPGHRLVCSMPLSPSPGLTHPCRTR
jgi:hypothetical protein